MRSRRKLSMWSALYPYLGGKRRLCPLIFREIDRVVPRRLWSGLTFLDAFLGGGSVSLGAKAQGFRLSSSPAPMIAGSVNVCSLMLAPQLTTIAPCIVGFSFPPQQTSQ